MKKLQSNLYTKLFYKNKSTSQKLIDIFAFCKKELIVHRLIKLSSKSHSQFFSKKSWTPLILVKFSKNIDIVQSSVFKQFFPNFYRQNFIS